MEKPRPKSEHPHIREPLVSGIFYPEQPSELVKQIDALLKAASPPESGARALVCPHAAIAYSGHLQALAYASARSRPVRTVIIMSPRHRPDEEAVFLPESAMFRTPVADTYVDARLLETLESSGTFYVRSDIPHLEEHAIEVQLPFLQRVFPDAMVLPLIVNAYSDDLPSQLAGDLDSAIGAQSGSILMVAVSNAGSGSSADEAKRSSDAIAELILSGASKPVEGAGEGSAPMGRACGERCIEALLKSRFISGLRPVLLGRSNSRSAEEGSGEASGESPEGNFAVVEYLSAAFF
jgi:AmmeMemoRadiSam system protein B